MNPRFYINITRRSDEIRAICNCGWTHSERRDVYGDFADKRFDTAIADHERKHDREK